MTICMLNPFDVEDVLNVPTQCLQYAVVQILDSVPYHSYTKDRLKQQKSCEFLTALLDRYQ